MKKTLFYLLAFTFTLTAGAQDSMPSFPKIVSTFFKRYTVQNRYEQLLNFAKKKTGWFYQSLDATKPALDVAAEEKFWTVEDGYNPNINIDKRDIKDTAHIDKEIEEFMNAASNYNWYSYERCSYYGYTGWEYDILRNYKDAAVLQDTLLEGLARAYSSLASSYLWYQLGGGEFDHDTLQRKLERLELPSAGRLDKMESLLNKSIATYERLQQQNPSYTSIIGNVSLKKFNETLNGYMQSSMAMDKQRADRFMQSAALEKEYILQAKNYLNSCDSNAILFTYGDNDTYQLWYVQQRENYRTDVAVINTSMLGLPVYIDMLKKNKTVSFTATPSFYGNKRSEYIYYKKQSPRPMKQDFKTFCKQVYAFKNSIVYSGTGEEKQEINAFIVKDIIIPVVPGEYNRYAAFKTKDTAIRIKLNEYVLLNDLMVLDITASNINNRPVYFSRSNVPYFDSNLVQQGIVYRLFPGKKLSTLLQQKEINGLENFAQKNLVPVIEFTHNNGLHFCNDGINTFFSLYNRIAAYYTAQKNKKLAKEWLDKCFRILPAVSEKHFPAAAVLIETLAKNSHEKLKPVCEAYADFCFKKYSNPSPLKGFSTQQGCMETLEYLEETLTENGLESDFIMQCIQQLSEF